MSFSVPPPSASLTQAGPGQTSRLFWRWWRKQSPSQQDRYATLGPLVSVLLFLAAIIVAFWYLRNEEIEREQESVRRDTEVVQQQIRMRLMENQEQLQRLAHELGNRAISQDAFLRQAGDFVRARPEVLRVAWLTADGQVKSVRSAFNLSMDPSLTEDEGEEPEWDWQSTRESSSHADDALITEPQSRHVSEPQETFALTRERIQSTYSRPYENASGLRVVQLQMPLLEHNTFAGTLLIEYSLDAVMRYLVPRDISSRHAMSLVQVNGRVISSSLAGPEDRTLNPTYMHDVVVTPVGNGLILRGLGFRTNSNLIGNTLFWMVVALSGLTVWTLMGTLRHMRRRSQIQKTLVQETNFRRAMENSMLTGMRTIDLDGRITYVNPAFCAMTGFSEEELIGCVPPYPYWPRDRLDEFNRMFQQELLGRSPMGGVEVVMQRRDNSQFDARMYVSPLIDAQGDQTGWMTSVTNITEAKRVRDQLTAAHERFTTVLEGLDAAVSVVSVQRGELLFANRSYRLWFGANAQAHVQLTGGYPAAEEASDGDESVDDFGGLPTQALTNAGSDTREVFVENVQKWFDVRARYIQWTDGNLAQMLIATDITSRRQAEEVAARQAEKSQFTSRLITMGEMASTVAHELNQPLAAIANYCSGMISRVQSGSINQDALVSALEKTSRQAQRAGQIIHRIRQFVKRSEPQRQPCRVREITDAVMDLAVFEMKRRRVRLNTSIAGGLPMVSADPILIEQVLLNLLKNAAEAIDSAQMPVSRRVIELKVLRNNSEELGDVVEFTVTDAGPGMKPDMLARLFEAFHSTKAEGLGIGLSLCRSIIESHHGRIRAENLYNGPSIAGCRFTFTLPIQAETSNDSAAGVSPQGQPAAVESSPYPTNDLLADNP